MNQPSPPQLDLRLTRSLDTFALDVDLVLPGQKVTALFGPSGCGKTSLLRAVAGLDRHVRGHITINGQLWQDDSTGCFVPTHQRGVGYVFQEPSLFTHLNVRANLEFGLKRQSISLRRVALEQAVELLGIGHLLERRVQGLSGGEQQRVAIARALASSPQLLLLDEPLAALDAQRKAELLPYLETLQRELNLPMLYVSHALDEVARLADHLVLLNCGKVTAHGPATDLLTRLDLPLAHGDAAAAVLNATVVAHDGTYRLSYADCAAGRIAIAQPDLPIGQVLRLRAQARDVSITLTHQQGTSILNILPATVCSMVADSPGQVMVQLDAGGALLLARLSAKSVHTLGLQPGLAVYAQIKGVAVLG